MLNFIIRNMFIMLDYLKCDYVYSYRTGTAWEFIFSDNKIQNLGWDECVKYFS